MARLIRRGGKALWWTVTLQLPNRLRARNEGIESARRSESERERHTYAEWVARYDTIEPDEWTVMRLAVASLSYRPLVSLVMPVYDTPERFLREAIDSVLAQVYEHWELCIGDDASTEPHVQRVLAEYARRDKRIRIVRLHTNGGISAASNAAFALARGELLGLVDHDDLLRSHALFLVVHAFAERPELQFVYSDEDKIDASGSRFNPYFKPDWNPALLLSQNYINHFSVIRTDLVRAAGGFRPAFDGSQDWDLYLRITRSLPPEAIGHVPHVLYHWRVAAGSAAGGPNAKPHAIEAAQRAIVDHLASLGLEASLTTVDAVHQSVRFVLTRSPSVTAIIPSTGRPQLLGRCVESLLRQTRYEALDVMVVVSEGASDDVDTGSFLRSLQTDPRVRVLTYPRRSFEYAWANNWAARQVRGEFLLLLNDDTEVLEEDWLSVMVGHALQDQVGAVGALLLYPDGTIQHAGVLLGVGHVADHLYRGQAAGSGGYQNRARLNQDLSAVTGACMLLRREAFEEVGGFDESFAVAYNDVDLCLRLRRAGWRVVFTPDAVLCHQETASFGAHALGREEAYQTEVAEMWRRWEEGLRSDPAHNPNLELDATHPGRPAFPPRVTYPWRVQASAEEERVTASIARPRGG